LRVLNETPVTGWTSLIVVLLLTSGTQLILMGLLGEYLWRVLDETRRRPTFIVRSKLNLEE
jgi:dolichol-phosphate mannosyltransferase